METPVLNLVGIPFMSRYTYGKREAIPLAEAILYGLSWIISRRPRRRQEFPSWTWVGWNFYRKPMHKTVNGSIQYSTIAVHPSFGWSRTWLKLAPIGISDVVYVRYDDGVELSCHKQTKALLKRIKLGVPPSLLRVYGFVFSVQLVRGVSFEAGTPSVELDVLCEALDWQLRLEYGGKDRTALLLCLILVYEHGIEMRGLLLASHDSHLYERIGLVYLSGTHIFENENRLEIRRPPFVENSRVELSGQWVDIV
jgi:hypothetical protein